MQHNILALELKTLVDNYRLLLMQSTLVLPKAANGNGKAAEHEASPSNAVSKWHIHTAPNPLFPGMVFSSCSLISCDLPNYCN